jgi:hypothetical protein
LLSKFKKIEEVGRSARKSRGANSTVGFSLSTPMTKRAKSQLKTANQARRINFNQVF